MPVNIGQAALYAVVIKREPRVIYAEQMQNRRVNVIDLRGIVSIVVFSGGAPAPPRAND
jgi:hypothetical protein